MSLSAGPIVIKKGDRLCQPMVDILVLTSAFAISMLALRNGSVPIKDQHMGFNLPSNRFPLSIKLPIFGPLEGLINGESVTDMTLQVEPAVVSQGGDGVPKYDVGNVLANIIAPIYSNYHERQVEWLIENVDADAKHWPMPLRFARTVRNAVVHGGIITIKNPNSAAVEWQGLSYSPNDNGREIYSDLNTGDLIALMIEIDREMNSLGAPPL